MKRFRLFVLIAFPLLLMSMLFTFLSCQSENLFLKESRDTYLFKNKKSSLIISKDSWKVTLLGEDGVKRLTESNPPSFYVNGQWESLTKVNKILTIRQKNVSMEASLSNGSVVLIEITSMSPDAFNIKIKSKEPEVTSFRGSHLLEPVEEIFGFGEMWNGQVGQRGQKIELWDKNGTPDECAYMPYYVSTSNYAFFINYGGLVSFDVGKTKSDELSYEVPSPSLDITLIAGNSVASSVENYVSVTGLPAYPPRWAFKPWFWLSNDPDKPGEDANTLKGEHFITMVERLNNLNIPIGVTWFEPPWQDARTSFIPNLKFSSDIKGLISSLNEMGVKTLAWTVPYTTSDASNWEEAVNKNFLVQNPDQQGANNEVGISKSGELASQNNYIYIDFFNPEASQWWQKQIEKSTELGLKGFKLDAGQSLEKDAIMVNGLLGKDVRNSYALEYNKVIFNAFKNKLGDDFLMIPRAAWIGSSAYHNFKWPGDLAASFAENGLRSSVYSSLSLALSGVPFVSTDIGGFQGRPCKEIVMVRWTQFGAFLPGMQSTHMPFWYSDEAIAHISYMAWLHTDLTPLWMSLTKQSKTKGTPVIRPLVWNYQDDVNTWKIDDQFTVGNDLLIAPILDSLANREVYLPEGLWYDYWNEKTTISGPVKFNWNTTGNDSIYRFPLYVKEGAIIPMEISNDVTGYGFSGSEGYVTLAIWPKQKGLSEFILSDKEDSVRITCERKEENMILVSWSETNQAYILRLHLNDMEEIENIKAAKSEIDLIGFSSKENFQNQARDGYFFEKESGNIWVRLNSVGNESFIISY